MKTKSLLAILLMTVTGFSSAGEFRDRIEKRLVEQGENQALPAGVDKLSNLAYGREDGQTLDVYTHIGNVGSFGAPAILMVHGGGWRHGDKAMARVTENKIARWTSKGIAIISINYRMLPETPVDAQLTDVARALAYVQQHASEWGVDGKRIVMMGHSAGAHLVALLASSPNVMQQAGAQMPLATVALDSAALNVVEIMSNPHMKLYDDAFGKDKTYWQRMSPQYQLKQKTAPLLLVCSSLRQTVCPESERFAALARSLGGRAEVLPQALKHGEINSQLGEPGVYTEAVESFLRGVVPEF